MMKGGWHLTLVVSTVCTLFAGHVDTANVLALFPLPARSHWFSLKPLITGLSQRGHNITLLINEMEKDVPENWDVIRIPVIFPDILKSGNTMKLQSSAGGMKLYDVVVDAGIDICGKLFQLESIQKLINTKETKFDLLLIEYFMDECLLGLAHKFSIPVVALSSFGGFPFTGDAVGDPYTPSYVPDVVYTYTDHMTFWQRLHNSLSVAYARYVYNYYYCPKIDEMMKQNFKDPTMPSVSALIANASLLIVQSHVSFAYPRPHLPSVIETGGMHIQQPQALPQDLKKLMDNANDGVIFFSMGSFVRSTDFPQESVQAFLTAFSKLKQLVLWKWETDTMPGKPENVHLGKWFPQSDLLAHKNVKLFISHGGLQSSLEATARGVPLIGIPVGAEQGYNVQRIVHYGYGIKLDLQNITIQSVEWAIHEVLNNPIYREKAELRSRLFWDRPESPVETAVYWTEYVLRHRGAPHLRSAALDLSWYQYLLLDVAALLLSGALLVLTIAVVAVRTLYRLITARTSASHEQKKKKTTKKE
ncbi:UDP-glycosyltransferase UGT5-like isoform X2 [Schistocerca nitens]|uniref:UDP-glycosyltransferase UGT5-like isoform X2 n=1 Tax=Schistocerca nitens TaxID=7011 RepID=UPI00211872D3|nr:UDP-glycosyltransferase UGT5-like isoform X2 [Schistocerca nitens]